MAIDYETALLDLATKHGRYRPNAYRFTLDAVSHTVTRLSELRHVSGKEVLLGIRELALSRYGPMAKTVFEQWGIRQTEDFGEIVFHLIGDDLLQKTADDKKEDFASLFDFSEAFDSAFEQSLASVEI